MPFRANRVVREAGLYASVSKVRKQLAYADRKGFSIALLVMDPESFVVRDMRRSEQVDVPTAAAAIEAVKHLVARRAESALAEESPTR